jgi:hypothetical protein
MESQRYLPAALSYVEEHREKQILFRLFEIHSKRRLTKGL